MAKSKRPAFVFPELESRGRRTILRTTEEVSAELNALHEEEPKERVKVTYRFQPEAVEAVEDIRRILRRQHGVRKVNREDIAQAAVLEALRDLESNGPSSFLAREFGEAAS
ncbi:MAG: hypothetical protein O2826_02465 [Chloroflexi bacterium]|nr:hypothetical protein [Chloroflexota bacterium]